MPLQKLEKFAVFLDDPADLLHGPGVHIRAHFFRDQFLNDAFRPEQFCIFLAACRIMPKSVGRVEQIAVPGLHHVLIIFKAGAVEPREHIHILIPGYADLIGRHKDNVMISGIDIHDGVIPQ